MIYWILNLILEWVFEMVLGFIQTVIGSLGTDGLLLFSYSYVEDFLVFFRWFGVGLFGVGVVIAIFDFALAYLDGKEDVKGLLINFTKGFLAVSCFTVVPVPLYTLAVHTAERVVGLISSVPSTQGNKLSSVVNVIIGVARTFSLEALVMLIVLLIAVLLMWWKFLKRGGQLLILICAGSLYMFSVPRGYTDGFVDWCKQIIGLCFGAFMHLVVAVIGLNIIIDGHSFVGLSIVFASNDTDRYLQRFGVESGPMSISSVFYSVNSLRGVIRPSSSSAAAPKGGAKA